LNRDKKRKKNKKKEDKIVADTTDMLTIHAGAVKEKVI
jgi:hypothetical protein